MMNTAIFLTKCTLNQNDGKRRVQMLVQELGISVSVAIKEM